MAADEGNRSVADYFVVAGLPKENPQLLDEYSLEVNLKPSAYQDPITDIAVIIPSMGENVPDYYQMIEETPGGHPADLNSGSFRANGIYVCYRRSRDRAPLLDIGVLYDGKERVAPDSQIVEFTPYGHSANVNNTHNSAVYLTYRRATEVSPPNEKVVMDICVIVTTKGDTVPHGFKMIDKTLNKGMVGSDVYLCYKKSMNRPDLVSYKPGLLTRLPLNNGPSYSLEDNVALFCMPMGATLECWPSASSRPAAAKSTFVLTLASREKVYGTAITFYEEYDEDLLTDEQKSMLKLSSKWSRKSDRKILANKCICLLSRWPFFEAFKNFLFFLHKRQLMGPFDVPLERFISHFLFDVPFPSPERPRILVQLSPEEKIALFQPEELPLPRSGASFRHLLANLGPENCLLVLLLALTEQTILIHSFRPDVLTSVCEAVMQIIFPFYWQCPYIPLCPIGMSNYLAAPLPVIVGLDSRFFDLYDQPEDVNAVDLDTNTITLAASLKDTFSTKLIPKKAAKQLRNNLENLMVKLATQVKMARELEAHNDETIDFVFKMKKPEMLLEMEIREAFLVFMLQILSGYKSYLLPIKSMPKVGATDVNNLFNQSEFLASRDKNYQKFYTLLMQTQMFTKFIEERSFVSETNTALAFFDECMEHYPDNTQIRFLELDFPDSDRTVFIMPPDTSGLPAGKEYRYEKFENLDSQLFEDKSESKNEENENENENNLQNNVFATPVSAIARRTKQEIKSAQKSAKKLVENPINWAKYLVNATYSLWFIHMPAFMVSNKATDEVKGLKLAIMLLQRMRRLRLNPIEEICFRVLMQLCGVYHQPQMAMEVMNQMNLMGMSPNAVTYGYYNKAVLESVWPEPREASKAMKIWQKLSLVLEVVRRFRQCGREAQTVNSFSRERMQLQQQQRGQNGGQKQELDNSSRSSQESGLSRVSGNNEAATKKPMMQPPMTKEESEEEQKENGICDPETPVTGSKGITRYSDIRGRFSNLLGTSASSGKPSNVNRVLFSKPDNDQKESSEEPDGFEEGLEPIKSRSASIESDDLGMMMGEPVTKPLPTVPENEPQNKNLLSPHLSPELHKVPSANSIKLMGVPVTDNDPLGALSKPTSPTSMQKSATASELLVNHKRPSLQDNILGSPFSSTNLAEMSRSSTMPLAGEMEEGQGKGYYFSMASIKSMTKTGTSKLSNLKKNSYLASAASAWMSPNSKDSLNKGISSLKSAYSSATSSISKRVEEFREQQQTPSKTLQGASSNPNLLNSKDEDTISTNSDTLRRPSDYDQPDSWSNFTGQIWDQLWSYSYDKWQPGSNMPLNQGPQSLKTFAELFEELYERMPENIAGPCAMELIMTSCSQCKNCSSVLYDEEIIAGWTPEDSNLNTKCPFCSRMVVPHLTIQVLDHRKAKSSDQNGVQLLDSVQIPYLSPLVLRKELETILEREGDVCLSDDECVNDHPIIYWNLLWFFERIGVSSHLPGMCLRASSLDKGQAKDESWSQADHRNVSVKIQWENSVFHADCGVPLYLQEDCELKQNKVKMICDGVQNKDLFMPLKNLLDAREMEETKEEERQKIHQRSIYREMMFVTLKSFGQDNIDLTAFDREYRRAFDKLPAKYQSLLNPSDRPPNNVTVLCRKFFRELKI